MKTYKVKYKSVLDYWRGKNYKSLLVLAENETDAEFKAVETIGFDEEKAPLSKQTYDIKVLTKV